jgi:DNA-binding transcriptional ArsR family regulator
MESRRDVFQAIADPTRRAILALLAAQSLTPRAIAGHFPSSRQTISRHIQILTECELVTARPEGREIIYQLEPQRLREIAGFLEPFRKLWDDRFQALEAIMKKKTNR